MKDLSESLKSYCAPRTIVGSIPHADGLQDAEERTAFLSLPPVLHLQLGRFFHEDELKAIHKKV